jgi:hypothetical protein
VVRVDFASSKLNLLKTAEPLKKIDGTTAIV